MAETRKPAAPVCPACGQPFRTLPGPKRRLLRGDEAALGSRLALCPHCRRRTAAHRLAFRQRNQEP